MREYQPIWEQLKKTGKVSISAHRQRHSRIIKAVVKEKYIDNAYKLDIEPASAILRVKTKDMILHFTLTVFFSKTKG